VKVDRLFLKIDESVETEVHESARFWVVKPDDC
jgi:paraquat-inducible protein B